MLDFHAATKRTIDGVNERFFLLTPFEPSLPYPSGSWQIQRLDNSGKAIRWAYKQESKAIAVAKQRGCAVFDKRLGMVVFNPTPHDFAAWLKDYPSCHSTLIGLDHS